MTRRPLAAALLAGAAGIAQLPIQALGQGVGAGGAGLGDATLSATISQRLEADTNLDLEEDSPGTSYFGDTTLTLGLTQETPSQRFTLGLDTGLRAIDRADEDFEFTIASPTGALAGYRQDWVDGALDADLRYRQRRVDFIDDLVFDEDLGVAPGEDIDPDLGPGPGAGLGVVPDDLTRLERDTTERRYDGNFALALRTDSPSSYRLGFSATRFDYSEDAEDLAPRTTYQGDASWTLRINPVLSGTLMASYLLYDAEDEEETEIRVGELDAGVIYGVSEQFSLNFGLGYADREREETIDGERTTTQDDTGPTLRTGLDYQIVDELSVQANFRVSTAAPDTRVSGDLRATYALPLTSVNARVLQQYAGDADGNEIRVTQAGIGLTRELDAFSSLTLDFAVARQSNEDVAASSDITRTDLTAVYSRSLTPLLAASLGYRLRMRDEDGSATSNAVFVSIGRSFTTRP